MDQLTAARLRCVRDHMRLECESDWDSVIAQPEVAIAQMRALLALNPEITAGDY